MKNEKNKGEPLVRLTKKDFRIEWYSGSGGGGQHRNKHANCCRVHHDPSGAMAIGADQRDRPANQAAAFARLVKDKKFQNWLRLESMKAMGKDGRTVDEIVEDEIKNNTVTEVQDADGKWIKE